DPPKQPAYAALWASALALPDETRRTDERRLSPMDLAFMIDSVIRSAARAAPEHRPEVELQTVDKGIVVVREPVGPLGERRGYPIVLAASRPISGPRIVAYVPKPLGEPLAAAASGKLLEEELVDAVVIAGANDEEAHGPDPVYSLAFARGLAS